MGIVVENEAGRCQISDLKQVEGEASCSSRKGKLIFFYEWIIKLGWKDTVPQGPGGLGQSQGRLVDSSFIIQHLFLELLWTLHGLDPELVGVGSSRRNFTTPGAPCAPCWGLPFLLELIAFSWTLVCQAL